MDIRDFRFRDQLEIISPNCETSFWFRDQPELAPLECSLEYRDMWPTLAPSPCGEGGYFWEAPGGAAWQDPPDPDSEDWTGIPG